MENTSQFYDLTPSQMVALAKEILLLQPAMSDCTITRTDGIDLDALLTTHLDHWYAQLLLTAPVEWLPVEDVAAQVDLVIGDDDVVVATPPTHCVRPVEWRLEGWRRSVTTFMKPDDPAAQRHLNPWTRAGVHTPAAIDMGDRLLLFCAPHGEETTLVTARCVVRPVDGNYRFHRAALDTLLASDWPTKIFGVEN